MPYALRWVLYLPRWPLTAKRLIALLDLRAGQRVLELGPGVGIWSLPVATALEPAGTLDVLDIQPDMLASLRARAEARGVTNLVATHGDAQRLPFADAIFDAVYVVGVLGELPDPNAALTEIRRVLKPDGRLVVGEALVVDPDGMRISVLKERAARAGLAFERQLGPSAAYFASFRK